ncbi:unnamed protein product [Lupinus luteus]|uniref:Uncharacterized protein n=1 Tax=Lupinus luteus TaxID=3873 RepID=A0AAV1WM90_LUPLU
MNASLVSFSFFLILLVFASGAKFEIERQDSQINGVDCKVNSDCSGCICGRNAHCACCDTGTCVCFRIDVPILKYEILNPDAEINNPKCKVTGSSGCKRCICGKIGPCSCCVDGVCACYRIDFNQTMSHTSIMY